MTEDFPFETDRERPLLPEVAFNSPIGRIALLIAAKSESDPAAVLLSLLVGVANIIGPEAYALTGHEKHFAKLYAVITGPTGDGRKGHSKNDALPVLRQIDPEWARLCLRGSHVSGEALLADFDDKNPDRNGGDKRGMSISPEFSNLINAANREGSILSACYRDLYDSDSAEIRRRKDWMKVEGVHVGLLGHITQEELLELLTTVEQANGFGNRFLWGASLRTKPLHLGGKQDEEQITKIANQIAINIKAAKRNVYDLNDGGMTPDAEALYKDFYESLFYKDGRFRKVCTGLVGSLTARAESHVLRTSVVHAVIDGCSTITLEHVQTALAIQEGSARCVEFIFGEAVADPVQDRVLDALRALHTASEGTGYLTQTDLYKEFHCNIKADKIHKACRALIEAKQVDSRQIPGKPKKDGRPGKGVTVYSAIPSKRVGKQGP